MIGIITPKGMDLFEPFGEKFFKEHHPDESIDIKHFRRFWENAHIQKRGYLLSAFDGDIPTGVFGVLIQQDMWSPDIIAVEVCWMSKGKEGLKLLRLAQQLARRHGAKRLYIQHLPRHERNARWYQKLGFVKDVSIFKQGL